MYDPHLGRFISPDPIIPNLYNPQDFNAYSYVRNNPLKYTDPTGNLPAQDLVAVQAGLFALQYHSLLSHQVGTFAPGWGIRGSSMTIDLF